MSSSFKIKSFFLNLFLSFFLKETGLLEAMEEDHSYSDFMEVSTHESFPLLSLPDELVTHVVSFLDIERFKKSRETCTTLNDIVKETLKTRGWAILPLIKKENYPPLPTRNLELRLSSLRKDKSQNPSLPSFSYDFSLQDPMEILKKETKTLAESFCNEIEKIRIRDRIRSQDSDFCNKVYSFGEAWFSCVWEKLISLDVADSSFELTPGFITCLKNKNIPCLEVLNLRSISFNDEERSLADALITLPSFKTLKLGSTSDLYACEVIRFVTYLKESGQRIPYKIKVSTFHMPHYDYPIFDELRVQDLDESFPIKCLHEILPYLKSLRALSLSGFDLLDPSSPSPPFNALSLLLKSDARCLNSLRRLDLIFNLIDDQSAKILSQIFEKRLPRLNAIDLSYNEITSKGQEDFISAVKNRPQGFSPLKVSLENNPAGCKRIAL